MQNPGQHDYTVRVKQIDRDMANAAGFYQATINFYDAKVGKTTAGILASDKVDVSGVYRYTLPSTFYLQSSGSQVRTYDLDSSEKTVMVFDSSSDGVTNGSATYWVPYNLVDETQSASWTVELVNGAASPGSQDRSLGSQTIASGETFTAKSIRKDGTTYVPVGGEQTYSAPESGYFPIRYVYYVPEGYSTAEQDYELTVQYVNAADGSVIAARQVAVCAEGSSDVEISAPETLEQDGASYVRLDGQEQAIRHDFYSSERTYTFYYRDVDDDLSAQTVITRLRVLYEPGTVSNTTVGAASSQSTTQDGSQTGDGASSGQLADSTTYNVINGQDATTITNNEGTDATTERIEETQTPLASGESTSSLPREEGIMGKMMQQAALVAGCIVAALLALLAVIWFVSRRKGAEVENL